MSENKRKTRRQRGLAVRSNNPPDRPFRESPVELIDPPSRTVQIGGSVSFSQYSGPLPPPEILQAIDDACPGGADRIITQMEEQGRHRRNLETIVITGDDRREDKGQIFGFILCMTVLIGGIVLLALGISIAGYISLIAGLGIPAGLFVYKKIEAKQELKKKRKAVEKTSRKPK